MNLKIFQNIEIMLLKKVKLMRFYLVPYYKNIFICLYGDKAYFCMILKKDSSYRII